MSATWADAALVSLPLVGLGLIIWLLGRSP
jgi:hypothetical protein